MVTWFKKTATNLFGSSKSDKLVVSTFRNSYTQVLFLLLLVASLFGGQQMSAQTYLTESFESEFTPNTASGPNAPSSWTQTRLGTLTTAPGTPGLSGARDWGKMTWSGSAWASSTAPNSSQIPYSTATNGPTGAQLGTGSAWFNDGYCAGSGTSGTNIRRLESPIIDLSGSSAPIVSFYHAYTSGSAGLALVASNDGGTTWNTIQTYTSVGSWAWTLRTVVLPAIYKVSNAKIGFLATNSWGSNDIFIDNVKVAEAGNITSTIGGGNWSSTATWVGGVVPSAGDNVTIVDGATVTIDATATAACNSLLVGQGVSGVLIFNATTARTITVGGNLFVSSGGTFQSAATGTITTHALSIAGNITNNGVLDFSTNTNTAGAGITFTGAANQLFSGTGGTTDLFTLTMTKTALANLVDFNLSNFTVRGLSTAATGALLTTNTGTGTLKFSGSNTFSGTLWSTASYTIPSTLGIWLNNSNFSVTGLAGSPTMSGLLRLTAGTYTFGTAVGNAVGGAATSSFVIEGGTLNIASSLSIASSGASFTMSSGTVNVTTVANASTSAGFGFTSTTSVISITGGTINLVQASSGATPLDYSISATSPTITGGTLNIGTASTATNFNFRIAGAIPTTIIDTTTNNKTASLAAATNSYADMTINSGATLNLNGFAFTVRTGTFTNNGTLTGTVASSRFTFASPTNAPQTFAGTGTVTSPLDGLGVSTTGGLTITHVNSIPTLRVNLFVGTITNSNKITLGTGAALPVAVQVSQASNTTIPGGFFDQAPNFNLGTGVYSISYLQESVGRTTGFEIPSGRVVGNVTINNTNGVTISGGDITATTGLTFTTGLLNTGSNTFILGTSVATPGTLTYTAGGFTYGSNFQRWVGTAAITIGNVAGQFPFSNAAGTQFRHAYFGSATATTGGFIKVQYNDVAGTTPVSISDIYSVGLRSNSNWVVSTGGSLAITNSDAQMRFRGDGIFTLNNINNFLAVGSSTVANGTSVLGTGTLALPEANKTLLSTAGLSQTVYVGTANTITSTATGGAWDVGTSWIGNTVPGCGDNVIIANGATVTVNAAAANSTSVTINAGGTLLVSGNTLTVGCSANNNSLLNNGTLSVSGGTLVVNGNINNTAASSFSQTGGQITVDGNSNVVATSVATGTPLFWLQNTISANVTLSGGTLTILDPHLGAVAADDAFRYSGGAVITAGTNHTLQLGNGVASSQVGGNTTNGFSIAANASGRVVLGNVVVNAPTPGTTRFVANRLTGDIIGGNLTVTAGEFRFLSGLTTTVAGSISNSGVLTTIGTLQLAGVSGGSILPNTAAQTIDGAGTFQNATSASTANFANLIVNNGNATGVTFNNLNSLLCTTGVTNTGTVSGTLTLTAGKINTGSNIFYLGVSTATLGTLSYTLGGFASGSTLSKWYAAGTAGTTITLNTLPTSTGTLGSGTYPFVAPNGVESRFFYLQRPATTGATGGTIRVKYTDASGVNTLSPTLADGAYTMDRQTAAKWTVSIGNSFAVGTGTFNYAISGANIFNPATAVARVVKQTSATTASLAGTFQAGTTLPLGQVTAISAANYLGDFALGFANSDNSFTSVASTDWNLGTTWNKGTVPTSTDNVFIGSGTSVSVSDARSVNSVTVNGGGTLTASNSGALTVTTTLTNTGTVNVSGGTITTTTNITNNASAVINVTSGTLNATGTLTNAGTFNATGGTTNVTAASTTGITIGTTGVFTIAGGTVNMGTAITGCNRTFTNNGILTVSSGTLNIYGNLVVASGSYFNQSGGDINVDGNGAGVVPNSSAAALVSINSNLGTVTGGNLTIVDPSAVTTAAAATRSFAYNFGTANSTSWTGHTLILGNGTSTDVGGNANGFELDCYVGSGTLILGNVIVNGGSGTNRYTTSTSSTGNGLFLQNLTINSGSEFRDGSATNFVISGNILNNGTMTNQTAILNLANVNITSIVNTTNAQTIGGSGTFRNSTTASTASFTSVTVRNTNATGVTLNVPLSISGTLTMNSGLINTTSTNLLTLGTTSVAGTFAGTPSATNMIVGPFARTFATGRTAVGTYDTTTIFPVGKGGAAYPVYVDPSTTGVVVFTAQAFNSTSGSTFSGGATSLSTNRFEVLPTTGSANLTNTFIKLSDANIASTSKILQSSAATGDYSPIASAVTYTAGTPNTLTTVSSLLAASYTGYLSYGNVVNCVAPTNQPSSFVVSLKGTTSFTGSFTAASSNPTGYLVVRYPSGGTVTPPADFTSYSVNGALGTGTVVYSGLTTTFNATGLTANTTYDFYVYSFNNSGCAGPVYFTTSPLSQTVTTCATAIGVPGTPTSTNLSTNGVTVSWTASSTSGVNYFIDVATNSGFTSLVSGYNNLNVGTVLTTNITGLTGNTPYWIRVHAESVAGCSSTLSSSLSITTLCTGVNVPYIEDFESVTVPALPSCTSIQTISGTSWTTSSPASNGFNSKTLQYTYSFSTSGNTWFYTRGVNLTAGTSYTISYRYGTNGYTESLLVAYGTSPVATSMTSTLADYPSITTTSPITETKIFTPSTSGVYYFGFKDYSTSGQFYLFVDDISVIKTPTCYPPTSLSVSNLSDTTAKVNWVAPASGTPTQYKYEIRATGNPGTGNTGLVASGTTTGTPLFVNISGLTANTPYTAYVSSDCGSGDISAWTTGFAFTTNCAAASLPQTQLFNSSTIPSCWSQQFVTGAISFSFPTSGSSPTVSPQEGTNMVYYNSYSNTTKTRLVSANLTSVGTSSVDVEFYWYHGSDGGATSYLTEGVTPQYSIDGGTTWTSIGTQILRYNAVVGWKKYTLTLPAGAGNAPSLLVGFLFEGNSGYNSYLDNVIIKSSPTCYPPTNITVSNITDTNAKINWTLPATGTPTQFKYEVRSTGLGGTGSTGLVASGTTTGAPLSVLVPSVLSASTTYSVYVQSDCGSGDLSVWSPGTTFTTNCTAIALPQTQLFNASTIPSCWSQQFVSGSLSFTFPTSGSSPTVSPQEGTNMVYYNSYSNSTKTRLVSANLTSVGTPSVDVEFYWYHSTDGGATFYLTEGVTPQYSIDGGTTWTSLGSQILRYNAVAGWKKYTLTLPTEAANISSLLVGFLFEGNSGYNSYLDNVTIKQSPNCFEPTNITATNVYDTYATFSANAPAVGLTPLAYNYEIRTSGLPGSGNTGLVYSNSGSFPIALPTGTLIKLTNYTLYVQSKCASDSSNNSTWSSGLSFTTSDLLCSGTPVAGSINQTAISTCAGSTIAALTLSGANPSNNGGISYQWEQSTTGIGTTGWSNAIGGTGATTTSYTPPNATAGTLYYRCKATCSIGGSVGYTSNTCSVTITMCTYNTAYTASGAAFTSIMPANGGNGLAYSGWINTSGDDNTTTTVPLSTTFQYQGVSVSGFQACTNGWMTFNTSNTSTAYSNNLTSSSQNQVLAPFWDDLVLTGQAYANRDICMRYSTSNLNSGNGVITIEWAGLERFSIPGPNLNFQVKLYENGNRIEFIYGSFEGFDGTVTSAYSYSIGYNGSSPTSVDSIGRFALQTANANHFSATTDPASLIIMPTCYSMYTLTPGIYSGLTTAPSVAVPANNERIGATNLIATTLPPSSLCGSYFTSQAATNSGAGQACATTSGYEDDDVWFKFDAVAGKNYTINLRSSPNYDGVLQLFGTDGTTSIACVNVTGTGSIETYNTSNLPAGTYFIRVFHNGTTIGSSNGQFAITVNELISPPINDEVNSATSLTVNSTCTTTSSQLPNTLAATASTTTPAPSCGTPDDDVWYSFTATSTLNKITVQSGTGYNAAMQILSSSNNSATGGTFTELACINATSTGGIETYSGPFVPGNTYFVRVYHSLTGSGTGNFTICVTAPLPACTTNTAPVDAIITASITPTLSWTASADASSYDIYLYPTSGSVPSIPFANSTTTSYTVPAGQSLLGLTQYTWFVVPKNGNGSATCSATNGTTFTTVSSCTAPSAIAFTNLNPSTSLVDLSWTAPTIGLTQSYQYIVTTSSTAPVNGTGATTLTGTSVTGYSGLVQGSTVYLWVRTYCGGSDYSAWASSTAFKVPAIVPAPWLETFDGADIVGYDFTNSFEGNYIGLTANPGSGITGQLYASNTSYDFQTVNVGPVTSSQTLSFDYAAFRTTSTSTAPASGSGSFDVQISTDFGATYSTLDTVTNDGVFGFRSKSYSLAAFGGQIIRVKISATRSSGNYILTFDNFSVQSPCSGTPNGGTINIESQSVCNLLPPSSLTVTGASADTGIVYQWEQSTNSGASWTNAVGGTGVNTTTYTPPIYAGTPILYRMKTTCVSSSVYTSNTSLVTGAPRALPYKETFETLSNLAGWNAPAWGYGSYSAAPGNSGNNANVSLYSLFTSASLSTSPYGPVSANQVLTLDYNISNSSSPYAPPAAGSGSFQVLISTDCGANYVLLTTVTNDGVSGYRTLTYPLSNAFVGQNVLIKVAATWVSGAYTLSIDNLGIITPPPTITSYAPTAICAGTSGSVVITGTNFSTISAVKIADVDVPYTIDSPTQITINLASGNTFTSGLISIINTSNDRANTSSNFTFNPFPPAFTVTGSTNTLCSDGSFTTLGTNITTSGNLWTSTNPTVASVDGNGKVTGLAPGTSTIGFSVLNNGCQTFNSNTYVVTVKDKIAITQQPGSIFALVGNQKKVKVIASGDGTLSYQWYRKVNPTTSTIVTNTATTAGVTTFSGATTNELTITDIQASYDGYQYYCVVSSDSGCSSVNSIGAFISIGNISIDSDPISVSQCSLTPQTFSITLTNLDSPVNAVDLLADTLYKITTVGTTDFTAIGAASNTVGTIFTATGAGDGDGTASALLTYKWGIIDVVNGYTPITDNAKYSGSNTLSLTVTPTVAINETYGLRIFPLSSDPDTYLDSNYASFSAQLPVSTPIISNATQTSCKVVGTKTFTVSTSAAVSSIQWQSSPTGLAGSWTNVGTASLNNTLTVNVTTSSASGITYYQAIESGFGSCPPVTSNTATLTITQPTVSVNQSAAFYCTPSGTAVTLTAIGTSATYGWTGTGIPANTTGATLNVTPTGTTTYTVTATDTNTCTASATATVTVGNAFTAVVASSPSTAVCPATPVALTSTVALVDPSNISTIASYTFNNTTSPYATIVGGTGTTAVTLSGTDSAISSTQTLPYSFSFGGNSFNSYKINSNGWITFDATSTSTTNYNSLNGTDNNVIAAFSFDMDSNGSASTTYYTQTVGTAPNRITKIEWTNFKNYYSTSNPNSGNAQIWLYENGTVEIRYGAFTSSSARTTATTCQVGLRGGSTSTTDVLSISNTGAWSSPTVGNTSTSTIDLGTFASSLLPDNGRVYRFTPKAVPPANVYTYAWTSTPSGLVSNATSLNVSPSVTTDYNLTVTAQTGCSAQVTKTVSVLPVHTIALTSGSSTPTLCINTLLGTNIVYTVGGGGTGAGVTGLPTGMTGTFASGTFTISGTPTQSGTFPYTVTTTGNSCRVATATGTITVNPNHAIALTSGSVTPTLCINTLLGTNIVYTVSSGATGAGVTGLPTGMTGTFASGKLTISGTPTQSGTFPYTVTTTGNSCIVATATGTITVNPNHAIALSSGSATPTLCINTLLGTNIVYALSGGATGAGVTGLPTGMTGTFASGNFTISGTPTQSGTFPYTVTTTGNSCTVATATGTITVNPNHAIALTSGSATPTLCINTLLGTNIVYTVSSGATGAGVTGLPTGMTGTFASGNFTISGTPTQSGTFPYTVTTTGNSCIVATATGTITVNPNHAIALSSGSATPTLCINTLLGTNIVYALSGGATGAGVTGLPTGMTGTFASGNFTISGTPTQSGTFAYIVSTSGNSCVLATANGSITVNPNNTIALSSAPATTAQTVYTNGPITAITYNTTGATGATFTGLPAGVTGSWSGNVVTITGAPTSSVGSPFSYTVTLTGGCATVTANGTITVNPLSNWYLDADGDHYYTGAAILQGPTPGAGYTTSVIGGGDCNDAVAAINPGVTEVCYNNIDDNCNGTLSESCAPVVVNMTPSYNNTTLVSLSTAIPAVGYTYPGTTNIKYRFSIKNVTTNITAADIIQDSRYVTIPSALHLYGAAYDIKVSAVINDEVVPFYGNTIRVNGPTVQLITLSTASCGATLATLSSTISANGGLNATGYTFRIRLTSDNAQTPTYGYSSSATRFVGANSFAGFPLQYNTSYQVAVQYTFTDPVTSLPVQSGYGTECTVLTPSIPLIGLAAPTCGSQVATLNAGITASPAAYATGYRFRIRLTSDNGPTPTYYYSLPNASRFSSLVAFQGITFAYNTQYSIAVEYSILNNSVTQWSGFGSECIVQTPFFPTTSLVPSQCGLSTATSLTQQLNIIPYPGFPNYKVKLDEISGESISNSQEIVITYSNFRLNQFSIAQLGKNYNVSVAIKLNGVFGDYSTACDLFTAAPSRTVKLPFKATAYPNPFANNFMLDVTTSSKSVVGVKVYDMVGRLIEQREASVTDLQNATIGDRYPSGVYNLVVTQEDNVETVRVVKR